MTFTVAAALRARGTASAAEGRVRIHRWLLDVDVVPVEDLATHVAAAYVNAKSRWANPTAPIAPRLPAAGTTTRTGDFGEIVSASLYNHRLGRPVPFQKLQSKPVAGATMQGGDVLALSLFDPGEPEPALVEVKTRPTVSPGAVLQDIAANFARVDDDYLVSAWAAGVDLMMAHPDDQKAYALSAAQHLARILEPERPYPVHARHAVVVTGKDNLTVPKVHEYWNAEPPVSELHVVVVPELLGVIDAVYATAGTLSYSDLASKAPDLLGARALLPGISAPVSSDAAAELVHEAGESLGAREAALWHLADWDGMGTARAREVEAIADDPVVQGLAGLLVGAGGRARQALAGTALEPFAEAVTDSWALKITRSELLSRTETVASAVGHSALADTIRTVGSSVAHRLSRHPRTLTTAAGADGPNVTHAVERMQRFGKQALWPSQAAAVSGGLLDRQQPSLAVQMPTSAGKTLLIELLVADTLDADAGVSVAVLAPTKALVAQLTGDLRSALRDDVSVRSSHGGLDFDIEDPWATGILATPGVAVMTPERFDLEWRRAATGDANASVDTVKLMIVDEAHLINDMFRGARLEINIGRALRRGIRVVLLSSQFGKPAELAAWLGGSEIKSEWTPTWLERFVYHRSADNSSGLLRGEAGEPSALFSLKPSSRSKGDGCPRERPAESAAIAKRLAPDGLVVVFANEKARIPTLVSTVHGFLGPVQAPDAQLVKLATAIESVDAGAAELLRDGIGLHHGDVPRPVRQAVETAARRNLLRSIVCTPTLLEGVDFPTRTVIAAYPPQERGRPDVARLRSLAGRAGRGGRYTSGVLVVMTDDEAHAKKWLHAFRMQLPVAKSGLTNALLELGEAADRLHLVDFGEGERQPIAVDGVVLATLVEGAVTDGDLRAALEAALGRTLWYSTTPDPIRERLLVLAAQRARFVANAVGDQPWSRAFYRSGLPLPTCLRLRDALRPHAGALAQALNDPAADVDAWLMWLATEVAPHARELNGWGDIDRNELRLALEKWRDGVALDAIDAAHSETWRFVQPALETVLPWVLTGAIEVAAACGGGADLRDTAHRRLGLSRLRYGVPSVDLCKAVQAGHDRVVVSELALKYANECADGRSWQSMTEYIIERLYFMDLEEEPS